MTRDDVIRLYEKANGWSPKDFNNTVDELERFAALVAESVLPKEALAEMFEWGKDAGRHEEREECANVLMDMAERDNFSNYYLHAALLVRARGQE